MLENVSNRKIYLPIYLSDFSLLLSLLFESNSESISSRSAHRTQNAAKPVLELKESDGFRNWWFQNCCLIIRWRMKMIIDLWTRWMNLFYLICLSCNESSFSAASFSIDDRLITIGSHRNCSCRTPAPTESPVWQFICAIRNSSIKCSSVEAVGNVCVCAVWAAAVDLLVQF